MGQDLLIIPSLTQATSTDGVEGRTPSRPIILIFFRGCRKFSSLNKIFASGRSICIEEPIPAR